MDQQTFTERVARLQEVNKVIEKLDPAIRAEAFSILRDYVTGRPTKTQPHEDNADDGHEDDDGDDRDTFFEKFDHDKPADNANLLAAYEYKEYGATPFSIEGIRKLASDVGLTIPGRIDMTFAQAKRDGKSLYTRAGTGSFKPTVHGEVYLKKAYAVKKGRKPRVTDRAE